MRPIKFRAWLVQQDWETQKDKPGRMIYFDDMGYCDEYNHLRFSLAKESRDPEGGDYSNLSASTDDLKAIMQFSGFKDRNGVEIYEGDIVQTRISNGGPLIEEVSFSEGSFSPFCDDMCTAGFHVLDYEVIGNIFERPIKN